MDSPLNHHTDQTSRPSCLDISPERLNAMSPSELEQAMEEALSIMTEESYDPAVIDAYLDALDQRAPMPDHPDAKASYAAFQKKVRAIPGEMEPPRRQTGGAKRLRSVLRTGLAAALVAACLLGCMVVAQAAGIDVFGALARWTESSFSFGPIQSGQTNEASSTSLQQVDPSEYPLELPTEYQELWTELKARGVDSVILPTDIPDGFQLEESDLYVPMQGERLDFMAYYVNGDNSITFNLLYGEGISRTYEKDEEQVELYKSGEIEYYIFSNLGRNVAAWHMDKMEYSLSTDLSVAELKTILNHMYQE